MVVCSHFISLDLSPTPGSGADPGEVLEASGRIAWVKDGPYHVGGGGKHSGRKGTSGEVKQGRSHPHRAVLLHPTKFKWRVDMKLSNLNELNNQAKAPPCSLPLPNPAGPGKWAR